MFGQATFFPVIRRCAHLQAAGLEAAGDHSGIFQLANPECDVVSQIISQVIFRFIPSE
jgi:hypothetical protein